MAQNTRRGTPRETVDHTEVMMELASHVTDLSQRFKELEAIQSEIPADIQEQLANYQQQLNALDEQMSALKRSTAGTKDYEIAMENAVAAMNAMAGIATELPAAIQKQHEGLQGQYEALKKSVAGIVQPLVSLSTILRTVLELVEGPLSLSNDAVERLSVSVEKRLSPSIQRQLNETMDRSFRRYEQSFKKMVGDGVAGLAGERERLEAATASTASEIDRWDARLDDHTGLIGRVVLLAAVMAVGVIVVAGGLWMVGSMLGITVAVPEMWERAFSAATWWSALGWALGALTLTAATIGAVAWVAFSVAKRLKSLPKGAAASYP